MMNEQYIYIRALKNLLEERKARNTNYSIRALARDLNMDNAHLAHILNGKVKVSPKIAFKLANAMKLDDKEFREFIRPILQ